MALEIGHTKTYGKSIEAFLMGDWSRERESSIPEYNSHQSIIRAHHMFDVL